MNCLERITVKNLFGHYNYDIDLTDRESEQDNLIIIYGDNGSGKTTILDLIFNLLSTRDAQGHKSKVASIKFESCTLKFSNNTEVIAQRKSGELIGSFNWQLKIDGVIVKELFLRANPDNRVRVMDSGENSQRDYIDMLNAVRNLELSVHYLTDERQLSSGFSGDDDELFLSDAERIARYKLRQKYERTSRILTNDQDDEFSTAGNLVRLVENLEGWIKKLTIQATKEGETSTNSIYTTIIKRVARDTEEGISGEDVSLLIQKIKDIRQESEPYNRYGLLSEIDTNEIEDILLKSAKKKPDLMYNILVPYIDALRARIDSLETILKTISLFVDSVNDYFSNKIIRYHISTGFTILNKEFGDQIDFRDLSSGEKQLLLLFCHILTANDHVSIFIIDEPEISLNVKWQRKLIDTLTAFAKDKAIQFIFASHSIEILSGYDSSVRKLESKH